MSKKRPKNAKERKAAKNRLWVERNRLRVKEGWDQEVKRLEAVYAERSRMS